MECCCSPAARTILCSCGRRPPRSRSPRCSCRAWPATWSGPLQSARTASAAGDSWPAATASARGPRRSPSSTSGPPVRRMVPMRSGSSQLKSRRCHQPQYRSLGQVRLASTFALCTPPGRWYCFGTQAAAPWLAVYAPTTAWFPRWLFRGTAASWRLAAEPTWRCDCGTSGLAWPTGRLRCCRVSRATGPSTLWRCVPLSPLPRCSQPPTARPGAPAATAWPGAGRTQGTSRWWALGPTTSSSR
mmetsp:Transcript_99818/g.281812  ORF Transcript_99818/g.281812 Transcript_99818/m.281812 type:complete len:244 (-) Transcript_99818:278-1009(-)